MSKVLVFDLDDTLYLERDYVKSGFQSVDKFLSAQNINGFFNDAWGYFISGGRGNTFNVVLDGLKLDYDDAFISQLVCVYREHMPEIILAGSVSNLLSLFSKKYHLGLITDGFSISQHNKIKALNLEKYIEKIVVTDDLGEHGEFWKPHTKSYELIKEFYGLEHSECVYIGDNENKDFIGAKKLGWKTVRIISEGGEHSKIHLNSRYKADYQLTALDDLRSLF